MIKNIEEITDEENQAYYMITLESGVQIPVNYYIYHGSDKKGVGVEVRSKVVKGEKIVQEHFYERDGPGKRYRKIDMLVKSE